MPRTPTGNQAQNQAASAASAWRQLKGASAAEAAPASSSPSMAIRWLGVMHIIILTPTLLLMGMGLDEFSMSGISIPRIKKIIRNANFADVKAMADEALAMPTAAEIAEHVEKFIAEKTVC